MPQVFSLRISWTSEETKSILGTRKRLCVTHEMQLEATHKGQNDTHSEGKSQHPVRFSSLQSSKQRTHYSAKSASLATVLVHMSGKAKLQDKLGCDVLVTLETHG